MNASNAAWLAAHADFIVLVVGLLFIAPLLQALARAAMPSPSLPSLWPNGRFYCSFVAVAFTVVFVKSLAEAIARSNSAPHDGSTIFYVAVGYAWCTFWFWAAMLGIALSAIGWSVVQAHQSPAGSEFLCLFPGGIGLALLISYFVLGRRKDEAL